MASTQPDDVWALDLGEHDGSPCPRCGGTSDITWSVGIATAEGRLCNGCVNAENPAAADMVDALDRIDIALAFTNTGRDRNVLATLIAHGVAHIIDTRCAEGDT